MRNEDKFWELVTNSNPTISHEEEIVYNSSGFWRKPCYNFYGYNVAYDSLRKKGILFNDEIILPIMYKQIRFLNKEWASVFGSMGLELFNFRTKKLIPIKSTLGNYFNLRYSADSAFVNAINYKNSYCIDMQEMKVVNSKHGDVTGFGSNGEFIVNKSNFWYIVNTRDSILLALEGYRLEYFHNQKYIFKRERSNYLINKNRELQFLGKSKWNLQVWQDSLLFVPKRRRWSLYDSNIKIKVPLGYNRLNACYNFENLLLAKRRTKYGVISLSNRVKIPFKYKDIWPGYDWVNGYLLCEKKDSTDIYLRDSFIKSLPGRIGELDFGAPIFGNAEAFYDGNFEFISKIPKYSNVETDISLRLANELIGQFGIEVEGVYKIVYIKAPK